MQQNEKSLTAILSALLEPQEHAGHFERLLGELQQSGEPEDGRDTGGPSQRAGRGSSGDALSSLALHKCCNFI